MGIILPLGIVVISSTVSLICIGLVLKRFHLSTNPQLSSIQNILPNIHCGACGFSRCNYYAKAIIDGKANLSACIPGGPKTAHAIADILGVETDAMETMMAVVHCKGGKNESQSKSIYHGIKDCYAAILVGNGSKVCMDGCIGLGSCVQSCPFDAIKVNENEIAVIDPDACTGCGLCLKACPRNLISLIPKVHKIYLACANHDFGSRVTSYCKVGCTGCSICESVSKPDAIHLERHLPVMNYDKDDNFIPASYKCPSKCFTDLVKVRPKANIDTKCDGCGECLTSCPVPFTISGEKGKRHVINKETCIGCGLCLPTCHAHAISLWGGLGFDAMDKSKRQRDPLKKTFA